MNSTRTKLSAPAVILLLSASLSVSASAQAAKPASPSSAKTHKVSHHTSKKSRKPRGQQAIDGDRALQIQTALIRERYMTGEPSGKWDDSTQAAMRKYQADQGWQSKSIPDSRALIRMGLGPNHEHLLNPESAMVSEAQLSRATSSGGTRPVAPVAARPVVSVHAPSSSVVSGQTSSTIATPAVTLPDLSTAH